VINDIEEMMTNNVYVLIFKYKILNDGLINDFYSQTAAKSCLFCILCLIHYANLV
jgi:hypothetical protein